MAEPVKRLLAGACAVGAVGALADAHFDDHRRWLFWILVGIGIALALGSVAALAASWANLANWSQHILVAAGELAAISLLADAFVDDHRRWMVWLLFGSGFLLVVAVSSARRGAWIELAGGLVLVLATFALAKEFAPDVEPAAPAAPLARVRIPDDVDVRATTTKEDAAVVLVLVDQVLDADAKTLRFESHRYEGTVVSKHKNPRTVAIERGKDDANLEAFVRDLAGAKIVYIRPALKAS